MNRLPVVFLLLAFAATPALRLYCEHPCDPAVAGAHASTDCHGSTAAEVKLVDGHDCSKHVVAAAPAVPVSKETRSECRFAATPATAAAIGDPSASIVVSSRPLLSDIGRPPLLLLRPLRI